MNTEIKTDLQKHVDAIAHGIQNGITHDTCLHCHGDLDYDNFDDVRDPCSDCEHYHGLTMDGIHYLSDVLDIQYIVTGAGEYLAARILVAFGGPNIWINTQTKTVEGYWGGIARSLHIITMKWILTVRALNCGGADNEKLLDIQAISETRTRRGPLGRLVF
jgi:hypothetical protein